MQSRKENAVLLSAEYGTEQDGKEGDNTMTLSSGNGFAPVPPELDAQGQTAAEFLEFTFEFEYCAECGNDADKHTAVIDPFGNWFAYCLEAKGK